MAAEAVALLQMSCCSSTANTSSTCATSLVAAWQPGGRAPEEATRQGGRADRALGQPGLQVLVNKRVGLGR